VLSSSTQQQPVDGRHPAVLLSVAIALGALLRFAHLGAREMSADEGASWAAASAASLKDVLALQPKLNPGKFAVHELLLHGWIRIFGNGLASIRALSALAGTLVIIAVFFVARELFDLGCAMPKPEAAERCRNESSPAAVAAFAALLVAVNLVFIKYAREGRMYSIALLAALIQVFVFLRSLHHSGWVWLFLTALFTAVAIASTFTMLLLLPPEGLWLMYLARHRSPKLTDRIVLTSLALISSPALLALPTFIYLHARQDAPALLTYAWAPVPPLWAPISLFNKATGSLGFPIVFVLAFAGWTRTWSRDPEVAAFLFLWMFAPPVLMLLVSYLIRPAFVERYMIASFVPFFVLVALGLSRLKGVLAQQAALGLVVLTAFGHLCTYWHHPHDVQWREAVQVATASPGQAIFVAPPYATDVVRYYLLELNTKRTVRTNPEPSATVAIVADTGVSSVDAARLAVTFPYLVGRLRGVIIRGRHRGASKVANGTIDLGALKSEQRRDWDRASAGWKKWWPVLERAAQPVSDRLVDLAGIRAGARVLDVATGSGEPAITAARRVLPDGFVIAVDQSPAMLAIGRERAKALGVSNIIFQESDGEVLAIEQTNFNAVLCRWGLMFMPDFQRALIGFFQRLIQGGRIALSVWADAEKVPMISLGAEAVRRLANLPPPNPDALEPLRLSDPAIVKKALEQAQFRHITVERMPVTFEFNSPEDFAQMREDVAPSFRALLDRQSLELRQQIIAAVREAASRFVQADGKVRLTNETILFAAQK
jgi:ubiquinone/menaquinone biosynthesis C-methylase UbiE